MENKLLYHYTSKNVIKNILTDKGINLRFSRYDCLNDTTEGLDAIRIQKQVCEQLMQSDLPPNKRRLLEKINNTTPTFEKLILPRKGESYPAESNGRILAAAYIIVSKPSTIPYICCFSKKEDSLPMWNYYSKDQKYEGYNMGVELDGCTYDILDKEMNPISNPNVNLEFWNVIYNDEEKKNIIESEILKRLENENLDDYSQELGKWSLSFKNSSFEHEYEQRLICWVPEEKTDNRQLNDCDIKFRSKGELTIPYIDVQFSKVALERITIGPLIEKKGATETLQRYLEENEYENVEICTSEIPIRY